MSTWNLYWIMKLDVLSIFFEFLSSIIGLAMGVFIIFFMVGWLNNDDEKFIKPLKKMSIILFVFFIPIVSITILLPDTKQMCALLVVPKVINYTMDNEEMKKMPDQIIKLGSEWLNELSPKK